MGMSDNNDKNLEIIIEELGNLPQHDLPEGFHEEIMAKVRREAGLKKARKRWKLYGFAGGLTAAAAVVFVVAVLLNMQPYMHVTLPPAVTAPAAAPPPAAGFSVLADSFDYEMPEAAAAPFYIPDFGAEHLRIGSHYPEILPTQESVLYGLDMERFDVRFEIRIAVEDINAAQTQIQMRPWTWTMGLVLQEQARHESAAMDLLLEFEFEELEEAFELLYTLGTVEEYVLTITDNWADEETRTGRGDELWGHYDNISRHVFVNVMLVER